MFKKIKKVFLFIVLAFLIMIPFKNNPFTVSNFNSSEGVIVIDAGHGGSDAGAVGINGNYEKDINLDISKKLIKNLKSRGYKVISTRDDDEYVDNLERAKLANKENCRLFISIHCNSIENNSSVNGAQVLYYPDRTSSVVDSNNSKLAQVMMDSIINGTGARDKGIVEREDLIVLSQTKMQAIIIECGFISNKNEEKLLIKDRYQNKMVDSIVDGVDDYFSLDL